MKKNEILVDSIKYIIDGIWWDYPQTDSESSGATDDNVMYRDVLPRRVKFGATLKVPDEERASNIINVRKKEECMVDYWDLETRGRVLRKMYPVCDAVAAKVLFNNDGSEEFLCEDIEIRFTQLVPDELM